MLTEHNPENVTETIATDVRVGMIRAYNRGASSEITAIERTSPRARSYSISYRSMTPRPDGHHNTVTVTVPFTSWLPILNNAPAPTPCPPNCEPCALQVRIRAFAANRKREEAKP